MGFWDYVMTFAFLFLMTAGFVYLTKIPRFIKYLVNDYKKNSKD
jgi:hypothetical protein